MQCVSRQWNVNARQNSQQTCATSVTIQAKSGPAAINKMQETQKSPKDQPDGSSFMHLPFPKIAFQPLYPAIYRSWTVLYGDCSFLCGLRKKLHGIKAARQGIKPMTCSQALLLSQSRVLRSWHRERNQWIMAFPCSCDILSDV